MKLDPKFMASLRKDSKASLSTIGVLGDTVVDINSQTATGPALQDGDELKTLETPNLHRRGEGQPGHDREPERDPGQDGQDRRQAADSGEGSVGQADQRSASCTTRRRQTVDELHTLAANLNSGKGTVGKLMNDDAAVRPAERYGEQAGQHRHATCTAARARPASC